MKQLDPKAVWLFFVSFLLRWLFVIVFLSIWGLIAFKDINITFNGNQLSFYFLNLLGVIILVFAVLSFVWAKLTYYYYRYELTENGFRKELGVIYKKYVTIPYDRIQNVDIYRGIWARILGLSDLNIQTAGASAVMSQGRTMGIGAEGRLPALSREVAEQLRDEIIQRAQRSKNQGL